MMDPAEAEQINGALSKQGVLLGTHASQLQRRTDAVNQIGESLQQLQAHLPREPVAALAPDSPPIAAPISQEPKIPAPQRYDGKPGIRPSKSVAVRQQEGCLTYARGINLWLIMPLSSNVDDDASIHDKLLWAIHMSGLDDLLKFLACAQSEQQWSFHILEIISLMFRDQTSELLVNAGQMRSAQEKQKDVQELELLRQKELAEKRSRTLLRGARHSRFRGSYVIQGLKAIGEKDVIFHQGLHNFKNYSHDVGKPVRRVPKRKQMAQDSENQRRSALNVRLFLREFCIDFLENCYNRLMYLVKEGLIRERAQQHDETYYLWAITFFMAFNRHQNFRPDVVSETISTRTFHFIEKNITNYYEMMLTDRKDATSWSRRMHLALKAYQELLLTVNEMDHSKDVNIKHSSNVIKSNIFYLMEFREIFLTLLRKYDERMQPRSFLRDLVESTHLFLKMLERFCKGRNSLVVQKKRVKRRKRSQKTLHTEPTAEDLEQTWQIVSQELRASGFQLSESLTEGAVPFDATSETPVDEQKTEALGRIQDCIMSCTGPEALSLLRAARAVWPEGDTFGSVEVEPEEELELLKQILFTKLPKSVPVDSALEEEDGVELEEEEELESVAVSETEFNFLDFIKRFANPGVVRPYIILLRSYSQNSVHTNHCITRMLHRLAVDLKMEALLYQLSIFSSFNKILEDPAAAAYQELVTFAKYVLNRFFVFTTKNNKAFVELLFWKNVGAVREMTEGYNKDGEGKKSKWTPEEEEQLQHLYEEYKESGVPDIVETILPLLSISRTRREVVSRMVSMGLVDSAKDLKKERKGTRIVLWTEEQEQELQMLFEEFKDSDDVLGNILKQITAKRSRARIVDKILSMGLVSDRRDLYKKRKRGAPGKGTGMTEEEFFDLTGELQEKELEIEDEEDKSDQDEDEQDYEELVDNSPKERQKNTSSDNSLKKIHSLRNMVQTLQQQGLSGPVMWLQNSLNRTADDREEDGVSHPVALVPLTEENEDAMENKTFQKLLRTVGIREPTDGQESFWRISSSLSVHQLRSVAASLDLVEEAAAEEDSEGNKESSLTVEMEDNDNQEMRAQALRALLLSRQRKSKDSPSCEGSSDTVEQSDPIEKKISKKRRRVLDDDDDDADDDDQRDISDVDPLSRNNFERSIDSDHESPAAPAKRRYKRVLSDEEEDN
ncbi:protein timeless homolog [Carassius auratus]|uniref:Protein timeless homolog n=1 Tax=Carassius auratus TaxID=7957 RepID=A0A6P6KZY1_CARAU|nr:protein timeless homolog [Carassius auratus]